MNKYEGLFILDPAAKEELLKEMIEKIQKSIEQAGGHVETIQKMDQRPFARTTSERSSGYYVNFIFTAPPKALAELDAKLHLETDIFRWQFARAAAEQPERPRRSAVTTRTAE